MKALFEDKEINAATATFLSGLPLKFEVSDVRRCMKNVLDKHINKKYRDEIGRLIEKNNALIDELAELRSAAYKAT